MSVAKHIVEFSNKGVPIGDDGWERILDQEIAEPLGRGARQEGRRIKDAALLVQERIWMLHENDHQFGNELMNGLRICPVEKRRPTGLWRSGSG